MSKRADLDHFTSRANEERARSQDSEDRRVSAAHTEMAERYEELVAQGSNVRCPLRVVSEGNELRP